MPVNMAESVNFGVVMNPLALQSARQRAESKLDLKEGQTSEFSIQNEYPPAYSEAIGATSGETQNSRPAWPTPIQVLPLTQAEIPATPTPVLGRSPKWLKCHHCNVMVTTRVKFVNSRQTHLAAFCCCLFCGLLFAFFPYCIDDCKDARHECPACNMPLGVSS